MNLSMPKNFKIQLIIIKQKSKNPPIAGLSSKSTRLRLPQNLDPRDRMQLTGEPVSDFDSQS